MTRRPLAGAHLPEPGRDPHSPCKRGCCWTPFGHSTTVTRCTCHPQPQPRPRPRFADGGIITPKPGRIILTDVGVHGIRDRVIPLAPPRKDDDA